MPRFHVIEERAYKIGYLVEAPNEAEAEKIGDYLVLDEHETDSWSERLVSVEQVSDEEEFAPEL
jgi:hypothetical protein